MSGKTSSREGAAGQSSMLPWVTEQDTLMSTFPGWYGSTMADLEAESTDSICRTVSSVNVSDSA